MATDTQFMLMAIEQAREAERDGEVPIGAVLVDASGEVLALGRNRTIGDSDPTAHAEIVALRLGAIAASNYRLPGCTMYTTIEPCAMCAGALVNSRISRLVYGARDERFGAVETHFRICDNDVLNHRMEITGGVHADECRVLVQRFFQDRRTRP